MHIYNKLTYICMLILSAPVTCMQHTPLINGVMAIVDRTRPDDDTFAYTAIFEDGLQLAASITYDRKIDILYRYTPNDNLNPADVPLLQNLYPAFNNNTLYHNQCLQSQLSSNIIQTLDAEYLKKNPEEKTFNALFIEKRNQTLQELYDKHDGEWTWLFRGKYATK